MIRILFAGSPAIALPSLAVVLEGGGWEPAGILTNPDRSRGRSGKAEPTGVGRVVEEFAARGLGAVSVLKPETLGGEAREAAAALKPDLLVSFAYGRIFGPKFMSVFPLGGINIHPSLLPKYRGPSPIQEAILRGDRVTGVCIQKIAAEMDSGDIIARGEIPLAGRETAAWLNEAAAKLGASLLLQTLRAAAVSGTLPEGEAQEGPASYCPLLEKDSGRIDWAWGAETIDALIRAYTPWPLAWTGWKGQRLYILEAAPFAGTPSALSAVPGQILNIDKQHGILAQTGAGILALQTLQMEARRALSWRDFLNGARDFMGSRLGLEDC